MAFDAGMLAAVVHEANGCLRGCKIEKIHGPSRDEVVISFRPSYEGEGGRLLISAGANSPRMQMTDAEISNPAQPPVFIQLLRKQLAGARLLEIKQQGFERAAELVFEARDELEYKTIRYLVCEIMGKYSNIILLDGNRKILAAIKTVDITTSQKRQIIPGMIYENPPAQDKSDPLCESREDFIEKFAQNTAAPDKFILYGYMGVSPLVAREIACGCEGDGEKLWESFSRFTEVVKTNDFKPVLVRDEEGKPCEYCFMPVAQYGSSRVTEECASFAELLDKYFAERGRLDRTKQRAHDLLKMIQNTESRLARKIEALRGDISACSEKEKYKRFGDLITSNMHAIKKGAAVVSLVDYYDEDMPAVTVTLDPRLSPSQNSQRYYKKYNKLKTGETELAKQLDIAENELSYIRSVADEFSRAESESDIAEIKRELYEAGYGKQMRNYAPAKAKETKPLEFRTSGGYRVLCGKNNIQNDRLTHKIASKGDFWFHIKNAHGSHVIMLCDGLAEPDAADFTEAATIAAYYSEKREGKNVEVDYTLVRNLKKPPAAKPGFVIYHTNYSAVVTPDADKVRSLQYIK
ncbi:MAG: NFACT family protein [Clostridia bacterium]|nr:NFACT family protein [Clostridia bacterium]